MLSVTVITLNEESNIERCLRSVQFADEIIIVDSASKDRTVELAGKFGAKVVQQPWRGYGQAKNAAMDLAKGPWVLNLDADEELTSECIQEIRKIIESPESFHSYAIARKTFYLGNWIRFGGWYPNYVVRLCKKEGSRWTEPNVHEVLQAPGQVGLLKYPMNHYTFTSISAQVERNLRYAKKGALDLKEKKKRPSYLKLFFKPFGKFLETYVFKQGFRDGLAGFIISINAAYSMFLKHALTFEEKIKNPNE